MGEIPSLRRIREGDGPEFKRIRLKALRSDPDAFASSYEREHSRPDETWETSAALASQGSDQCFFVAESDGRFVGMAGAYRPERQPRSLHLIAMWVDPAFRRLGLGLALANAIAEWGGESDADELTLWVVDGQHAARRVYERAGFEMTDIQQLVPEDPSRIERLMRLPLVNRFHLPPGYIEFAPMTSQTFETYLEVVLATYATHLMEAHGIAREQALRRAHREVVGILPTGVVTPGMHLATIREGLADSAVGWIWFGIGDTPRGPVCFLYDLSIFAAQRDRGVGSAALEELEEWASGRAVAVVVQLFEHQRRAILFFERLGYRNVATVDGRVHLSKDLPVGGAE